MRYNVNRKFNMDLDLDLANLSVVDSRFKTFAESFCNGDLNYYGMLTSEEMDRAYFSFSYNWGKDLGELDIIVKLMSGACTFVAENLPDDFPWDSIYSILCDANLGSVEIYSDSTASCSKADLIYLGPTELGCTYLTRTTDDFTLELSEVELKRSIGGTSANRSYSPEEIISLLVENGIFSFDGSVYTLNKGVKYTPKMQLGVVLCVAFWCEIAQVWVTLSIFK